MELKMNKEELYQQIENFKQELAKKYLKNNIKEVDRDFYYVSTEEAIEKASFVKYLIDNGHIENSYNTILDMTFGSGNLISHIVFDNDITYETLYLNDTNIDRTNQNIKDYIDNCTILDYDILEDSISKDINVNLIILNPQLGGSYEGDLYQQRQEKEKNQDILNKLALNINTYLDSGATVLFYGEDKDFKALFGECNYIRYKSESKQLYIVKNDLEYEKCFQKINKEFKEIDCNNEDLDNNDEVEDFDTLDLVLGSCNDSKEDENETLNNNQKCINLDADKLSKFSNETKGNIKFPYKNILFKGVPGTGKSETIKNIITDKLDMKELADNVLRINIHSASSNSDLMQGISISTTKDNENVLYREKQGAILNHIFKAIYKPKQPFVLVLEEIQENSLNELIGDLIYLIEDKKRTTIDLTIPDNTEIAYDELFSKINEKAKGNDKSLDYVELPSLVENSQNNTKMIVPDNLFIFCTSNYRDDKKVIEDNLLRRFDVIEIYPKNREQLGKDEKNEYIFKSDDISKFLEKLNNRILEQFKNETHPDRYMIGHANWLDVKEEDNDDNRVAFYKALLKVIIEFKEIREIDFDNEVKPILENVFKDIKLISDKLEQYLKIFYNDDKLELKSYKHIVDLLQKEVYKVFL
jgi:hypothetical protein